MISPFVGLIQRKVAFADALLPIGFTVPAATLAFDLALVVIISTIGSMVYSLFLYLISIDRCADSTEASENPSSNR